MPVGDSPRDEGTGDAAPIATHVPQDQTGFFDNISAGYKAARAGPSDTRSHENAYASPYYDHIVAELNRRGYRGYDDVTDIYGEKHKVARPLENPMGFKIDPRRNQNPLAWAGNEAQAVWDAVRQERLKDQGFLKDIPDRDALATRINHDRQRDYASASEVMDRANIPGHIGGFLGQIAGGWDDPVNMIGMGAGGAAAKITAREVLKGALVEGGVNAAGAALALPGTVQDAHNLGIDMTPADMAEQVATNAAFGMAAHGVRVAASPLAAVGGRAAGKIFDATIEHLPEPVKTAAAAAALRAGTIPDRAMTAEAARMHSPFTINSSATPDEAAALHVVNRDADLREASPFHPAGDAQNEHRLDAVMSALGVKPHVPDVPSSAPLPASHPARTGEPLPSASYGAAILKAEGYNAKAPAGSTITGYGQFSNGTWLGTYKSHFGGAGMTDDQILALRHDKAVATRMIDAYGQDNAKYLRAHGLEDSAGNRSLAHFLGVGDAAKVLRAAPSTPIEQVIAPASYRNNQKLLRGKSASELISWAHKRIGEASGEPVGRADAVPEYDPGQDTGGETITPPIEHRTFAPHELITDATAMQYKSGGDMAGITDRLKGVEQWNPLLSGKVVAWERADGSHVIVDGHQRLGLAQRIAANDPSQDIRLDAVVVKERDGVTARMARVIGALKNIAEGTGTVVDAARVLRDAPEGAALLPPNAPNVRQAKGLLGLSNDAFGAVLNDVIDPAFAAQIGDIGGAHPERHMALIALLKDAGVTTPNMAATVVKQALNDGFGASNEQQLGLFGEMPQHSLYGPAARVLDAAKRQLRDEKRSFKTLTTDATRIEGVGNKLDRQANQAKVIDNETALAIIDRTAHSSGPVRDALLAAAREHLAGNRNGAVRQFLRDLDGIDLQAAARGVGDGAEVGLAGERSGHAFDGGQADAELADGRGVPGGPTAYDEAVAAGQNSLGFSDPVGAAAEAQTHAVEHDLAMELRAASPLRGENVAGQAQDGTMGAPLFDATDQPSFRLSEEGPEQSFHDILGQADADIKAVEALRNCL